MDSRRQVSFATDKTGSTGLTFVELAVVTAVIGVAMMIAYPYLSGLLVGRKLVGFAGELAGVMDFIRARSVIDGRIYHAHFDRHRRQYWVTIEGDQDRPMEGRYGQPQDFPGNILLRSVEVENRPFSAGNPVVRFYPRGNADQAVIYLESSRRDRASIRVKPFTGRSEVYNYFYRD